MSKKKRIKDIHKEFLKNPDVAKEFNKLNYEQQALDAEFADLFHRAARTYKSGVYTVHENLIRN